MFKNTGVLFENDILQAGIKSDFRDQAVKEACISFFFFTYSFSRRHCHQKQQIFIVFTIGAISVFYGNKTSSQFQFLLHCPYAWRSQQSYPFEMVNCH